MVCSCGQGVIAKVVHQLGGVETAAARFEIRASLLRRFVNGTLRVPDIVLLKAVDLLHPERRA